MFSKGSILCLCTATLLTPTNGLSNDGFQDPSVQHRAKFRYWLPDASISPDIVTKDIRDVKAAGAGGLEILPFYLYGMGEQYNDTAQLPDWSTYGFGTPAFNSLFKSSLKSAKEAGIVIDFALGANQGQGVPSPVGTPGLALQLLMGIAVISPGTSFNGNPPKARQPSDTLLSGLGFMHPVEQFETPVLKAVTAYQILGQPTSNISAESSTVYLNESSFLDLTSLVKENGSLEWTPPESTKLWKIFTFWEAYTNQRSCDGGPNPTNFIGNGSWTVDHFSKEGAARVTDFWDEYILSDDEIANLVQTVGNYAWEDSMEILAALYWTPGLLKRFEESYGYSLLPHLPVLFGPSNTWGHYFPVYEEVYEFGNDTDTGNSGSQLDYRNFLNDGYREYLTHFLNWTHSLGIQYSAQPAYNLPLQMLSDISLLDAPEGESLAFATIIDAYRQFSGPAHLSNKTVISTELGAVQVPAYSLRIPDLLQQIKRSLAGGFTMHVLHGFPSSTTYPNTTWPGYTTFFYGFTDMWNQVQPAWQHMRDTLDFVGRNQWVVQQGVPKVDLVFHLYESPWVPETKYNSTNLEDLGYTYGYVGPDNLVTSSAFVKDQTLGIPGYKALVFNNQTITTVEAAKAIVSMASAGLTVIFIDSVPTQAYPANSSSESALIAVMTDLQVEKNFHQIGSLGELPSLLSKLDILPRVALNCTSNPVYSVYRTSAAVDYVYFFNDQAIRTDCTATITGSKTTPYIYDAWTSSQTPLLRYSFTNNTMTIPLSFASNESTILALHRTSLSPECTFPSTTGAIQSLTSATNGTHALITGPATLTSSSGKTYSFNPTLPASTNLTTWDLTIEDWHSAPDRFAVKTEVTKHTYSNISLAPWSQISDTLTHVSGIGHYTTRLTVSASTSNSSRLVGILTLPLIQHTARVYLDGILLRPVDPVKPVVMLEGLEGRKTFALRIVVSTTLFNRVKYEKDEIMVVGQVAGVEQPLYDSTPYEMYGLVGTVTLDWAEIVTVDC